MPINVKRQQAVVLATSHDIYAYPSCRQAASTKPHVTDPFPKTSTNIEQLKT
jgi:hypothetical protein